VEAEQTVEDFYSSSVQGDFDRAYEMLSPGWKQAFFPSQAELEGTFADTEDVTFVEGPTARLSDGGNRATVTGTTRAELTTETQKNEGTWFLVRDDGEWRIDSWDVNQISSTPA
jgi:hypothetical protein